MNLQQNKKFLFPIIFGLLIVIISVFFHYTIHFIDSVNNETLTGYAVNISIWRILFEPFLGMLLFFNRALYAINEFPMTLIWLLIILVIYTIVKPFLIKEKQSGKTFIIRQIINIPLLIGLWFTLFVIMIFIPLPNNTIVNNSPNSILVTTHSHSEYSHDGLISQKGLWEWHKRNGFDAFFITEHNNHDKTLDFVNAQRKGGFPVEPLVMCGEEFSGSNHLSLLGLKKKFSTRGFADSMAIDSVRSQNGAVIVNHWFDDENKSLEFYRDLGVDGFEIANTAVDRSYDLKMYQKIKDFCQKNQLIMNGGLDFHGYGNMCSLWNAFDIPNWHKLKPAAKEEAILNVLKTRDQDRLKVVFYQDRPYYDKSNLFFSPLFTTINYFKTLNFYQVLSWILWIVLLIAIKTKFIEKNETIKKITLNQMIPTAGFFSALFLLTLGFSFYSKIERLIAYNDIFIEYSELLFYAGGVLLVYSGVTAFFRFKRS